MIELNKLSYKYGEEALKGFSRNIVPAFPSLDTATFSGWRQGIIYLGSHRTLRFIIVPLRIVQQVAEHSLRINAFYVRLQNEDNFLVVQSLQYMKLDQKYLFCSLICTTVFD